MKAVWRDADVWLRAIKRAATRPRLKKLRAALRHPKSSELRKQYRMRTEERWLKTIPRAQADPSHPTIWFEHYRLQGSGLDHLSKEANVLQGPRFSVLLPTYNANVAWLSEAIDSVIHQIYPHWELICVDDGSPSAAPLENLRRYAARDSRIQAISHAQNRGVSVALNTALLSATGEYVIFLDHDDLLEPHALFRFATSACETNADLIYADEVITQGDDMNAVQRVACRPAFSYDYYLSHPYFVHPVAVRRSIAAAVQFDERLSISQDVDFVLRVLEKADRVAHIPDVLYRWRTHTTSLGHDKMSSVGEATRASLTAHLVRRGFAPVVSDGELFNLYKTTFYNAAAPSRVAIVIPTRNNGSMLARCIEALRSTIAGRAQIFVVDHETQESGSVAYLKSLAADGINVMPFHGKFNFSRINNEAVRRIERDQSFDFYLFLNDDVIALEPGWLEQMLDLACRRDVGAVGATLLYDDKRVQHAGVLIGMNGLAEHAFKFMPYYERSRPSARADYSIVATRDFSAVTAACLMVPAATFAEVGGFDELLEVGFGDTDLCLRIRACGYAVLNAGGALLHHVESATRGRYNRHEEDTRRFVDRYAQLLASGDPYYSPLLSLSDNDFSLDPNAKCPLAVRSRVVEIRHVSATSR